MERMIEDKLIAERTLGDAEVFIGRGILPNVPATVSEIFEGGTLCLLYDEGTLRYAEELSGYFKDAGFRLIVKKSGEGVEVPDYVRFIFGAGGGSVADETKRLAERMGIDCAFLFTAPSTDNVLTGYCPKQVFIDENIFVKCPKECIAAGWGIALSEPLRDFENYFAKKVLAEKIPEYTDNTILAPGADLVSLGMKLLEIGARKQRKDTAEIMAEILYQTVKKRGEKPRLIGEYKFLCGSALTVFYSSFLGSPAIDALPPACHDELIDEISRVTFASRENLLKSIDIFDANGYFRISYILGEYRMDLLERLSGIDLHAAQRFWRRLYPDAGYWLKHALTSRTVLKTLALAGELSGGLLGYAAATGFTERFRGSTLAA